MSRRVHDLTAPKTMTVPKVFRPEVCTDCLLLKLAVLIICACPVLARAEEAKTTQAPKPSKTEQKKSRKELTGAELYAIHCNRCHPERYAPERTDVQWKTILTHMRVRVNLPAKQAQAILKFLQEDSGK